VIVGALLVPPPPPPPHAARTAETTTAANAAGRDRHRFTWVPECAPCAALVV